VDTLSNTWGVTRPSSSRSNEPQDTTGRRLAHLAFAIETMAHHFLGNKHHGGEATKVTDWRKEEKHPTSTWSSSASSALSLQEPTLCTRSTRRRRTPSTRTRTRSRKGSPPPSPWAAPALPSTSTTRRKTPRSTATMDTITTSYSRLPFSFVTGRAWQSCSFICTERRFI
jgi:hypothetical protein